MKLRLAWLADSENSDSYSAREARILMRALAEGPDIVPLWFAVGSEERPHFWHGVRVFPVPEASLGSSDFLRTLIAQQQPDVILTSLSCSLLPVASGCLNKNGAKWAHRILPEDADTGQLPSAPVIFFGSEHPTHDSTGHHYVPYIRGLHSAVRDGADASAVLYSLKKALIKAGGVRPLAHTENMPTLVMRQQLFCNMSVAQVMFELANSLLELGVPVVPQAELDYFSREFVRREERLYRSGAPEKYKRVQHCLHTRYNPEAAITLHFTLLGRSWWSFPALSGREILYVTGTRPVSRREVRSLENSFEKILAPSRHALQSYLDAGLGENHGVVIPHGIDPAVFCPQSDPIRYPARKKFKFLQTSFPFVNNKGFDLTVKAFGRAFSSRDDVCLILRVPKVREPNFRKVGFNRLRQLVNEESARRGAPEIHLLEVDVEANRRGGVYTGADCYVFPLRAEGFGMTILEAMACGLPVIATAWSGPADFMSARWAYRLRHSAPVTQTNNDSTLHYFVEPELDHLIYLMRYAYEHQAESKILGQRAAAEARINWTWRQAAEKLARALSISVPAKP